MTDTDETGPTNLSRFDRPSQSIPSIDTTASFNSNKPARGSADRRDRAQHRVYHGLYEDMLN